MQKHNLNFAKLLLLSAFAGSLLFSACKKDDDTEQENITRVVLHFTGDGFDQEFEWKDLDGDGGNAPTVPTLQLPIGKVLNCHIHVYDDTKSPVEDLTEEIEAESAAHLWVFESLLSTLQIEYDDQDSNGKKFGLETKWTTTTFASGTVKVTLFHEPTNKDNLSAPGGETDFTASFPVNVQ